MTAAPSDNRSSRVDDELGELAKKLAARAGGIERSGWAVKLSENDSLPIIAHVLTLDTIALGSQLEPHPTCAIFLSLTEDINSNAELIASMFELTPAETRLLACLLAGRDRSEASKELRVGTGTVKTHLKAIFRKTGVARQSELILLTSRLTIPVHGFRLLSVLSRTRSPD